MPTDTAGKLCACESEVCKTSCPGYGSQSSCPPLIVLAVLSARSMKARNPGA